MSDSDLITVSILVPTYNRAPLLKIMVESVLKQSFKDWELLLIDDVSTDNTEALAKEYSLKDSRIKYFRIPEEKFNGISRYLNFGINKAKGEFISRIDDDDYWIDDNVLSEQVDFLKNNQDYGLVGGGVIIVDEKGKALFKYTKREKDDEIRLNALIANPFAHNTVMFRKKLVQDIGGYANLRFAEDWDLWLRMGKVTKLYNFQKPFTAYLTAGQNASFNSHRQQTKQLFGLIKNYKNDYPNYRKGFILNTFQYAYSFLPAFIRRILHSFLIYIKRHYF